MRIVWKEKKSRLSSTGKIRWLKTVTKWTLSLSLSIPVIFLWNNSLYKSPLSLFKFLHLFSAHFYALFMLTFSLVSFSLLSVQQTFFYSNVFCFSFKWECASSSSFLPLHSLCLSILFFHPSRHISKHQAGKEGREREREFMIHPRFSHSQGFFFTSLLKVCILKWFSFLSSSTIHSLQSWVHVPSTLSYTHLLIPYFHRSLKESLLSVHSKNSIFKKITTFIFFLYQVIIIKVSS